MPKNHAAKRLKESDARSSENLHVANALGWKRYVFLGCLLFLVFYWMIPTWLNHELNTLHNNTIRPIAETLFIRRIYWIQSAGIALGSVCILFAIRNYLSMQSNRKSCGSNINFFSRLFAKLID